MVKEVEQKDETYLTQKRNSLLGIVRGNPHNMLLERKEENNLVIEVLREGK